MLIPVIFKKKRKKEKKERTATHFNLMTYLRTQKTTQLIWERASQMYTNNNKNEKK